MPEIHHVFVQLSTAQVADGYYTLDGDLLTMVYSDGEPVRLDDGAIVTHTISDQPAPAIARVLTKKIRRSLMGEIVEGFTDPIVYMRKETPINSGFGRSINYPRHAVA